MLLAAIAVIVLILTVAIYRGLHRPGPPPPPPPLIPLQPGCEVCSSCLDGIGVCPSCPKMCPGGSAPCPPCDPAPGFMTGDACPPCGECPVNGQCPACPSEGVCPPCKDCKPPEPPQPEVYAVGMGTSDVAVSDIPKLVAQFGAPPATLAQASAAAGAGAYWCVYAWAQNGYDSAHKPVYVPLRMHGPGCDSAKDNNYGLLLYGLRPPELTTYPLCGDSYHYSVDAPCVRPWNGTQWSEQG